MALTHEQALELCTVIEDRRAVLLDELRKDLGQARADSIGELAGPAPDAGDESVARAIAGLDQAEAARDVVELNQLDEARRRFDEGSYGVCVDCGRDIDYRRLRASPAAIRCIHCQERFEKTYGSPGRASL
ncbi:MAG TPA: TraR/DksA family transcriptional regulator [Burkholderiales bacterium]|jgi:RNA polymerase-binding transcription factor DksA